MQVDLSKLPAPDVIETISFEAILETMVNDLINRYPSIYDTIQLESEPVRKLLEVSAYRELVLRARYNDEARALLLAHAKGANLDHIGSTYYDENRLTITEENSNTVPPTPAVMETDDAYRYRLSMKPESYSVAGPRDAFKFHALSASGTVKDASVISPEGGTTQVFILAHGGSGIPDEALLTIVSSALNSETVRPLSEEVIVSPATIKNYVLDIDLVLFSGATVPLALAAANEALDEYVASSHLLDFDIHRSAIDASAHQTGVKKVVINSPAADVICSAGEAPWCSGMTVRLASIE